MDDKLDGHLTQLLKDGDVSAKRNRVSKVYPPAATGMKRIYFIGLGRERIIRLKIRKNALHEYFSRFIKIKTGSFRVARYIRLREVPAADAAHALSESCLLAVYEVQDYKHKSNEPDQELKSVCAVTEEDLREVQAGLNVGAAYGQGANSARTLVNMPGNMLTATDLASYAAELAAKYDFECEILEKMKWKSSAWAGCLLLTKAHPNRRK